MAGDEVRRGKEGLSGGHMCHVCGYQYPNPNPSAKLRRSHRRNCRKETVAGEDGGGLGVCEQEEVVGDRNAGERIVLGGEGGELDGGNGATEANGGNTSGGSAEGDGNSAWGKENADHTSPSGAGTQIFNSGCVETVLNKCTISSAETANESIGVDLPGACTNASQHEVVKHCSETAPLAVVHPAEREDSFDEYQDASPFLHQPNLEDCAAVAHVSDIPTENQNMTNVSLETNGAANEVSVERNVLCKDHVERNEVCKDQFSREPSVTEFSAGSNVGKEIECYSESGTVLAVPEASLNVDSTDECSVNIDSNNAERSSHGFFVQDISDVQLPVENSFLINSVCSVTGYQNDLDIAHADGILNSEDILVKGSELDFTCEEKQQDAEQIADIIEQHPCLHNCSGLFKGVCNEENDHNVTTKYQVSTSQEHVTLLMDQASCFKNPFNLDDTRSDDLFELASPSYHLEASNIVESKQQIDSHSEASNIVESKQQVDSTSLKVPSQTSIDEGQHSLFPDGMIDVSSKNGNTVGAEDLSVSSTADHTTNISLHDASVDHSMQEAESHTSGISFVPSEGTMIISQEINAPSTYAEEMIEAEDTVSKYLAAVEDVDNFEEKKQVEETTAKEMDADNVEEEKLTENASAGVNADNAKEKLTEHTGAGMNAVQHGDGVEEKVQTEYTGAKVVGPEESIESIHEKNQTEETCAEKTDTELNADNGEDKMQADDSSEKAINVLRCSSNVGETNQPQETNATKMNAIQGTNNAEEKETESTAVLEGNKPNQEIAAIGARLTSGRIHVPLKVLLAEASAENKEKKPSTKERVLSFRRRVSKDDTKPGSPKSASEDLYWNSPAKLPRDNTNKASKARKQPWLPFICCHSVH